MKPKKLFRRTLFGYKKSDVYAFIDEYARDIQAKMKQKEEEISNLAKSNRQLQEDCNALRRKIDEFEAERDKIASVLLKAEETAKIMLERAERNALKKQAEIEAQIEMETVKLQSLRAEMKKLLRAANQATHYIKNELNAANIMEDAQ